MSFKDGVEETYRDDDITVTEYTTGDSDDNGDDDDSDPGKYSIEKIDSLTVTVGGDDDDKKFEMKDLEGRSNATVKPPSKGFEYRFTVLDGNAEYEFTETFSDPLSNRGSGSGLYTIPFGYNARIKQCSFSDWQSLLGTEFVVSDDNTTIAGPVVSYDERAETVTVRDQT